MATPATPTTPTTGRPQRAGSVPDVGALPGPGRGWKRGRPVQRAATWDRPEAVAAARQRRRPRRERSGESPLRLFRQGKRRMADAFERLLALVGQAVTFVGETAAAPDVCLSLDLVAELKDLTVFREQTAGLRDVILRDHMKAVFVGQTSNGKSTVVNALLSKALLPAGMGHTTNCFVQVEGSDDDAGYVVTPDSDARRSIHTVRQLASALTPEGVEHEASLIRVFWPRPQCRLLGDDVVLMDSPGLDLSSDVDNWIEAHCMDADVFVLVVNAEATLKNTVCGARRRRRVAAA